MGRNHMRLKVNLSCGSMRQRAYVLVGPWLIAPLGNWANFHYLAATLATICQLTSQSRLPACCVTRGRFRQSCNGSNPSWFCKDSARAGVAAGGGQVRNRHSSLAPLS